MSPRRSNLSLNQKLTLAMAVLAIITAIFAAFISGHDWFSNTPSLSEVNTATLIPSQPHSLNPIFSATPTSTYNPTTSLTDQPAPEEPGQIAIIEVKPSSGSLVPVSSTSCLWTEAIGEGASLLLTLEAESTLENLRIALFGNFVTKIRLTFSDRSQQTYDLLVIRDYEYQEVVLEPVKTSSINVEVLEVIDNFVSDFGICHIEVFGTKP